MVAKECAHAKPVQSGATSDVMTSVMQKGRPSINFMQANGMHEYQRSLSYRGNRLDWRGVDKAHPLISLAVALHHLRHALAAQSSSAHPTQANNNRQLALCELASCQKDEKAWINSKWHSVDTRHHCCAA